MLFYEPGNCNFMLTNTQEKQNLKRQKHSLHSNSNLDADDKK